MSSGAIANLTDQPGLRDWVIDEGDSMDVIGTLVDAAGSAIALAALASFSLTLYDETAKTYINSRSGQDILNANNCTVTSGGVFTLRLGASDSVIVGSSLQANQTQGRILRFAWTYSDGVESRSVIQEYRYRVRKLAAVSAPA